MHSERAKTAVAAAIVVLVGVFYLLTIRPGHYWGDDFALYILHAKNIAEGTPYGETGFIYNASYASLSPRTYPPVYPLMLAPVIRWGGMNLEAMKMETMLLFPAALFVIFLLFRYELRFDYAVALLAMLGFSPFFWDFKDGIRSDVPFLFFVYLAFWGVHLAGKAAASRSSLLPGTLLAGVAACLACETRTLGFLIVPSLWASDLVIHKKPTRLTVAVTLMCAAWVVLQTVILGRDASYFDQFAGWSPRVILSNSIYAASLAYFWANGYSKVAAAILCMIFCGLAVCGYLAKARERVTILEVFLPLYLLVIVSWPAEQGFRFLIPIMPLFLFYSFLGLERIRSLGRIRLERRVFVALMAAVFISYAGEYSTMDFKSPGVGVHTESAGEFFKFVAGQTRKDDVFVFAKPRALVLFTGRRASACHVPRDDMELWNFFEKIGATYVALGPPDDKPLRALVERNGDRFVPVYSNADFRIYRIRGETRPANG